MDDADIRVLLMVVLHLSGDLKWLGPTIRRIANEDAWLSPRVRAEIRGAALDLPGSNSASSDKMGMRF